MTEKISVLLFLCGVLLLSAEATSADQTWKLKICGCALLAVAALLLRIGRHENDD